MTEKELKGLSIEEREERARSEAEHAKKIANGLSKEDLLTMYGIAYAFLPKWRQNMLDFNAEQHKTALKIYDDETGTYDVLRKVKNIEHDTTVELLKIAFIYLPKEMKKCFTAWINMFQIENKSEEDISVSERTQNVKSSLDGLTEDNIKTLYAMAYSMASAEKQKELASWAEQMKELNQE